MDSSAATALVFIAAFALVLGIIIVINFANYHTRRLKSEERLTAIAKGLPVPSDPEPNAAELMEKAARASAARARGLRTGGLVLASVGVGLGLLGVCLHWILQQRDVLAVSASGLVPLAIGIGLIVDYSLRNSAQKHDGD